MHPSGCCVHAVALVAFAVLLSVPNSCSVEEVAKDAENQRIASVEDGYTDDDNRLCHNVDIRNNLKRLELIKNCTVITGFLQMVLIERTPQSEFVKYEFKNLRYANFLQLYTLFSIHEGIQHMISLE